jgi:glycosyltransferase involved in cell wall biosynthesis
MIGSDSFAAPSPAGLRIAMALYGTLTNDSRVIREAETLARAGHTVTVYCLAGEAPPDAAFRSVAGVPRASVLPDGSSPFLSRGSARLPRRVLARTSWMAGYARTITSWGRWALRQAGDVDVWHVHDLTGLLAIAPFVGSQCRLVYDSHEIFMETGTARRLPTIFRRLLSRLERTLCRRAAALVTVNEDQADVLNRRLSPRQTIVVRNCPPRWQPPTAPELRLREAVGIGPDDPLVLYHGIFVRDRGFEELAEAILEPGLERVHVAFLGFGQERDVVDRLQSDPRFGGRIHVLEAVAPSVLLDWVTGADIDAVVLQPSTLNHWLGTPNKLWESLTAGVPVVVSDFPAMRRIVLDDPAGPLGEVCEPADPASIATAIRTILAMPAADRLALRQRCNQVAESRWNWETESARLLDLYAGLARHQPPARAAAS